MGKYSKSFFENPYLEEESKKKLTADMVLDEVKERRLLTESEIEEIDLALDQKDLADKQESADAPSSSRFKLTQDDLMGKPLPLSTIRALDYSPSYRPVGELEEKAAGVPMSTSDRYDILAGDYEAPPEDISFLSDAQARLDKFAEGRRSGKLRRDTRRLETSVEERRRELMRILPERDTKKTERIIKDVRRKRAQEIQRKREESGEYILENAELKKAPVRRVVAVPEDAADAFRVRKLNASRYDRLPLQDGFEFDLPENVEMDSQSRDWSSIRGENPRWSEIQKHSSHTVPEDEEYRERFESEEESDFRAHYIRDEDFDPTRRYTIKITSPRARLRSAEGLNFENEYIKEMGIEPERVRELVEKDYRGRWVPPEFFYDDELVSEWFGRYNRGLNDGEDFIRWAAKQRRAAQNVQLMGAPDMGDIVFENPAPMPVQRPVSAHPVAYQSAPDPREIRNRERRRLYDRAMRAGYAQGAAIARGNGGNNGYRGMYPDLFAPAGRPVPPGYSPYPPVPRQKRTDAMHERHYAHERTGEYLPRAVRPETRTQTALSPQFLPNETGREEPLLVRKEAIKTYPTPKNEAFAVASQPENLSNEFVFGNLEDDFVE